MADIMSCLAGICDIPRHWQGGNNDNHHPFRTPGTPIPFLWDEDIVRKSVLPNGTSIEKRQKIETGTGKNAK
jgi:hypothetical protein